MSAEHGSCDCGQVEWDLKLGEKKHILCHCRTCQKLSGGAYTLNQIVPNDNLTITKGKNNMKVYTYSSASGNPVHCYYCANCTTHVYHHQTVLGDQIVVRTGLLDEGSKYEPTLEIFGKDRLFWQKEVASTLPAGP